VATRDLNENEDRIQRRLDRRQNRGVSELRRNYREALERIREDLRKAYDKYAKDGKLTQAEMTKFDRLRKLERQLVEDLNQGLRKNVSLIRKLSQVQYEESFYRHAWAVEQAAGVNVNWGILSADAVEAAVENDLREIAIDRLRRDGRTKIRRAVTQGVIRGTSFTEMAKEVKDAINGNFEDAERIARTEGGRAQTEGSQRSFRQAHRQGVRIKQVWDATLDRRTRRRHADLDGEVAENRGTETDPNFQWYVPGIGWIDGPKQSGVAEFDINCRCVVRPEIEGYSPEKRRSREDGVKKFRTFKEWANDKNITANRYGEQFDFVED
jgi:SPP1 gp7 family putative phage head morphogenesis protein